MMVTEDGLEGLFAESQNGEGRLRKESCLRSVKTALP